RRQAIRVRIDRLDINRDDFPLVFIIHTMIPPEFIASYFVFYLKVLVLGTVKLYHLDLEKSTTNSKNHTISYNVAGRSLSRIINYLSS
ncbi:MAG TPA: hypothetical protein VE572_04475, partial [Nitrososphaeraceae archaeon]|nr:hypothetical protein [Nitrososphaeraceae archaeon]